MEGRINWQLPSLSHCRRVHRENIDLNRVPQVIHEASCNTRHSCNGLDSTFGLETIPISLRMPVLKKNPNCFPTSSYSLEFELITVACICAFSRNSWSPSPAQMRLEDSTRNVLVGVNVTLTALQTLRRLARAIKMTKTRLEKTTIYKLK